VRVYGSYSVVNVRLWTYSDDCRMQSDLARDASIPWAEEMDAYVKEHDYAGWFDTSAKENKKIDDAAKLLVSNVRVCAHPILCAC